MTRERPIRIGVSSCLLGNEVRYDGGHKRDRFLTDVLAPFVELVPVCPELEMGMGVPRESVQLVREGGGVRMRGVESAKDHTRAMRAFARRRIAELQRLELSGYVLKQGSPSCGLERVRVQRARGRARRDGTGLFAAALRAAFPHLPIEDEGRLGDPALREGWIERVFAWHRLRALFASRWTRADLAAFHTAHEIQLLAHCSDSYARLGRIVAGAGDLSRDALRARYEEGFMSALEVRATPRRHARALLRMLGSFREELPPDARQELLALVEGYRRGIVPRVVPLTLIRHHARRFDIGYLRRQHYLEPHPSELMLRNHV